jgi:hypothetical protein
MRWIQRVSLITMATVMLCGITSDLYYATCYGSDLCNACKNCNYCGHCAKQGGSCGVCKRALAQIYKGKR